MRLHLILPLLIGIAVEIISTRLWQQLSPEGKEPRAPIRLAFLIAGIIITYVLIMSWALYKETAQQFEMLQLDVLHEALQGAKTYFAVSTIPLKEWFDPYMQVYFATIVQHQLEDSNFLHERVLFFFTKRDLQNTQHINLDGYYAKALKDIHIHHHIPLAFLERRNILHIVNSLSFEEAKTIGLYPKWVAWLPNGFLRKYKLKWRRRFPELDYALVEDQSGVKCVFPFKKHGEDVIIERNDDPSIVRLYEKVTQTIRGQIHVHHGTTPPIAVSHDFTKKVPF